MVGNSRRAQLLVDRHQVEIAFGERLRDVHGALRRMQADQLQPARQLGARLAPRRLAERRGNRIAVEDREHERAERIELRRADPRRVRAQHALDHLRRPWRARADRRASASARRRPGSPARGTAPWRSGRRGRGNIRRCPSAPERPHCSSMKSASAAASRIGGWRRKKSKKPIRPSAAVRRRSALVR